MAANLCALIENDSLETALKFVEQRKSTPAEPLVQEACGREARGTCSVLWLFPSLCVSLMLTQHVDQ